MKVSISFQSQFWPHKKFDRNEEQGNDTLGIRKRFFWHISYMKHEFVFLIKRIKWAKLHDDVAVSPLTLESDSEPFLL